MRLDPLMYAHPLTGAVMPVTPDLLAETYLAPRLADWDISAGLADPAAPWAESLKIAPSETQGAVERALRGVMQAAPGLDPAALAPDRLPPSRARLHLAALCSLWAATGTLPRDLAVIRHVLSCDAGRALAPLPVLTPGDDPFATAAEAALAAQLARHHGTAPPARADAWRGRHPQGAAAGALAHVQRHLLAGAESVPRDATLAFLALRDSLAEAHFAAALARRMLEDGRAAQPSDIALLVPETPARLAHLAEAFADQGVPLSGLPETKALRDLAGEVATLALRCLRPPAPAMALASLAVLPLMPWPPATGAALARDLMRGNWRPRAAGLLQGKAATLWQALRTGAATGAQLAHKLGLLADCLTAPPGLEPARAAAQGLLRRLQAAAGEGAPDWQALSRMATLAAPIAPPVLRLLDGVSLLPDSDVPWRGARHLIVTGFAAGAYPSDVPSSPVFLDSEVALIRDALGLHLPSREAALRRGLALFARQIGAASDSATFLCPQRDGMGRPLAPPMTLSLIARLLQGGERGLVRDLTAEAPASWPTAHRAVPPLPAPVAPLPADGVVHLGRRDLLRLHVDEDGRALPQSPSRLEWLLVSPLAWLLGETGATDRPWAPETLDIMLSGTLAHHVLEHVFAPEAALPALTDLPALTEAHLAQGIARHAPFLAAAEWQLERETLRREALRAVEIWHVILSETGARILRNEIRLEGNAHGIEIRGRADCILQLGDGHLVIVDHKKGGSARRRLRMREGWDLQIGLYRAMLARPIRAEGDGLDLIAGQSPAIAYHLLNDGTVLASGLVPAPGGRVEGVEGDISAKAVTLLQARLAEVGGGSIRLNGTEDEAAFAKTAALTAYALDASPLLRRFMVQGLSVDLQPDEGEDAP
jgi:hypothetical protein